METKICNDFQKKTPWLEQSYCSDTLKLDLKERCCEIQWTQRL